MKEKAKREIKRGQEIKMERALIERERKKIQLESERGRETRTERKILT